MGGLILSGLYFYPVKSVAGVSLNRGPVDARGVRYDRHWMVVDVAGRFVTQRQYPKMSQIQVGMVPGGVRFCATGMPDLDIPLVDEGAHELEVEVWGDLVHAHSAGTPAAYWLSQFLGLDCQLVYLTEQSRRAVDPDYADPDDQVGFADGFPFLLISEASLEDLNSRLETPVPMTRFRPNLVVKGCEPYAEDGWKKIRIGQMVFRVSKPCSRCVIPTIDPATGKKAKEPLKTLNEYRQHDNKVYFGQNLLHDGPGELEVGADVELLE
ncbi:MAG: MOSC domain-containing protein [Gammaproteobacteria bacterium]|nr:MOSC domain-containing protein [Gammaproteobacteria bacterium]